MKLFGGLSLAEALGEQVEYELPAFGVVRRLGSVSPPPSAHDYATFAKHDPSAAAVVSPGGGGTSYVCRAFHASVCLPFFSFSFLSLSLSLSL